MKKYKDKVSFKWAAVRTEKQDMQEKYLSGFNPDYTNMRIDGETADKQKYPYLQLADFWEDLYENSELNPDNAMVEVYTKHYTSLLKYIFMDY